MSRFDGSADRENAAVLSQRLTEILRVSEALASVSTLSELCGPVLDTLFKLLPQTHRAFLMLGDSVETLAPYAMRRRSGGPTTGLKVSRSICKAALEKRAALVYREGGDEPIEPGRSVIDLRIHSAIALPLMVGEEIIGMVVIDTRDASRDYDQNDMKLAAAVCHQVAIAIKNAQLISEVEDQTAMRNNLMRFLPEAMANQVLAGHLDGGLGGRNHRATLLFSDLIGFTARAEGMRPEELVGFMNRYFTPVGCVP